MVSLVDGALPLHHPSAAIDATQVNAKVIAQTWLDQFALATGSNDVSGTLSTIWKDGFWRDLLPLTLSYRSLGGLAGGHDRIASVLTERLALAEFSNFKLDPNFPPEVQNLFPDCSWIMLCFNFSCKIGISSGIARLVPKSDGSGWEAFTISTILEGVHGVEENINFFRENSAHTTAENWPEKRHREIEYEDRDPEVLIIGASQSGLDTAARLKAYGIDALCIDRTARVGDSWRLRYASLRLHDPVWYDHLPYIPFPPTWPVYCSSGKLANWLESYAESLELNIWTSTNIVSSSFDEKSDSWTFEFARTVNGKVTRRVIHPKFVVWCCGLGGGVPRMPVIEGMDIFKGTIVHSSKHGTARDWIGKKAIVVGACTSAHDISKDFYDNSVDITMIQRTSTYIMSVEKGIPMLLSPLYVEGGPPVDFADRINASIPNAVMKELHKRVTGAIADADKDLLDGLHSVGFQTNMGPDASGFLSLAWEKAGGYYLDVGASQLIIDGKIKLKSGHGVKRFTKDHIVFDDDSTMEADVVVFATGYGDARVAIRTALGDEVADNCRQFWGLDFEREINGCYAGTNVKNFYLMAGNLALCRFNSKLVALQIRAQLNGLFSDSDRCELTEVPLVV